MDKKRILLGGNADFVAAGEDFFSNSEKFTVMIAEDGEAMLAMLEEKPDLAIVDIDLPKRGGDECCRAAKRRGISPATLIALAVSTEKRHDVGRCIDAGCDIILPKPLRPERLSGVATRFLFNGRRIPYRFPVRFMVSYGIHPDKLTDNYSANLTTLGMFVETEEVVPVGDHLHLAFDLPHGGTRIECTARVTWLNNRTVPSESVHPSGIGLEFLEIETRHIDAIEDLLCSLAAT